MDALNKAQLDIVLLGLRGVAGVASSMDIDLLLHSLPDTFNLFCLALIDHTMSDTDSSEILDYYQIAGQSLLKSKRAKQRLLCYPISSIHGPPKYRHVGMDI